MTLIDGRCHNTYVSSCSTLPLGGIAEGIEWSTVSFVNNQECLDLVAKKPTGLLPLLDKECRYMYVCTAV